MRPIIDALKRSFGVNMNSILSDMAVSISELKKNPMAVVDQGDGFPVAVLNRNQPAFYCVPAAAYELLMDKLEDIELADIAKSRLGQKEIKVSINEL